jgi:hypothetical protein
MPGGDGTGPMGMGPMTGRAAGYCAGYPAPGYVNPVPGRPLLYGPGYRVGAFGYGVPYGAPYAPAGLPWYGRGFGFGRGPGRRFGRGRGFRGGGRFGRWW